MERGRERSEFRVYAVWACDVSQLLTFPPGQRSSA